jgi:HAD superfamily hydrolase (TIGR01549 family)
MLLVNKVPGIQERYHQYRDHLRGVGRIKAWMYLLSLNVQYYVLHQKYLTEPTFLYVDKKKKLNSGGSESSLSYRENPIEFAQYLAEHDVISFDVFDTLILRCFSKPTDLFFEVGEKLEYPDFEHIRREIEGVARERKYKKFGHREVNFEDIWEVMEQETGIPADNGMKTEWETEKKYCFANPYFLKVIEELKKYDKKLIITSDMYLHENQIRELLVNAGYPEFDAYFVSCEYGTSKSEGTLYKIVKEKVGLGFRYVHVGDNEYSDQKKAKEKGFSICPYQNVNTVGNRYRCEDMSVLTGSMYRGIVNSHLHNGLNQYSMTYEFGFVYGGLFVLGYCQFIHDYVKTHQVDKILFLARDGDILNQVYQQLYPQEAELCNYVYWSRLAATKMSAGYFKYDYFRRFLYHKVNQNYTLQEIFRSMELEDMLEEYLSVKKDNCNEKTLLTLKEADAVKEFLMEHWEAVLEHYNTQLEIGKSYYGKVLDGCHNVVAVDVGWAGSGAVSLDYIVNHIWKMECEVVGLLAGTNSIYNAEPYYSESQIQSGKLVSYLFSQKNNRDVWKIHNPGKGHNVIIELLLASEQLSFRGFSRNAKGFEFSRKTEEINSKEVQRGIRDFVKLFCKYFGQEKCISGRDAMAPILLLYENEAWIKNVIDETKMTMNLE